MITIESAGESLQSECLPREEPPASREDLHRFDGRNTNARAAAAAAGGANIVREKNQCDLKKELWDSFMPPEEEQRRPERSSEELRGLA